MIVRMLLIFLFPIINFLGPRMSFDGNPNKIKIKALKLSYPYPIEMYNKHKII